ncbi:methionyl-tRNA formyltransferase [Hansschlegelia beijingensis]|uniref:methionyl-tRNA formyltransferase n=2 Tax=Bacteria TaxID=2 RepID=UPI00387EF2D3
MRLAIVGRTAALLATARRLIMEGHSIGLVVTPADVIGGEAFEALALAYGAAFIRTARINSEEIVTAMRLAACELGVSLNWRTLIKPAALASFARGVINGHAGDLPRYRGNACPNWAILRGEAHVGLCVHQMTQEIDAGPVFARARLRLTDSTYITDVQTWIDRMLPELFSQAVSAIGRGDPPEPQNPDPAVTLRCYPRRPEDARIEWREDARDIHRLVRASSHPFDGAFCYLDDERVSVWRADVVEPRSQHLAVPGQPCEAVEGDPMIACGSGFMRLRDVTVNGRSNKLSKALLNRSVRLRLT